MRKKIINLNHRKAIQAELSGGKGAGLAYLVKFGYQVPSGFIVTTPAFKEFLMFNGISLTNYASFDQNEIEVVRESILKAEIPPAIYSELLKAFEKLNKPLAVRSSMVGEDSMLASCAGQLDTFLDVDSFNNFIDSIKRCYSCILNDRLRSYMKESRAADLQQVPEMAIVIQEMVKPVAAGVAFSADPISGQRGVLIEAVRGSGEKLANGKADPDRYRIDARGVINEYSPIKKNNPVLHKSQISELNKLVTKLTSDMKIPVDVEWAIDRYKLHLLQVRPITSLAGKNIYSNRLVSDMSPGLIKPLLWSSNVQSMAVNVFGRLFTDLLGVNNYDFTQLTKRIHSRNYTNMTLMGELLEQVGLPANFMEVIARDEKSSRPMIKFAPRMLSLTVRVIPFFLRYSRSSKEMHKFVRSHKGNLQYFKQTSWFGKSDQELFDNIENLMKIHGLTQWYVVVAGINMMVRNKLLSKFVRTHAPDIAPQDLLRGLVGLKALEPNQKIQEMASETIRLGEDIALILLDGDIDTIESKLNETDSGRKLLKEMQEFMDKYGFLSAIGTDFSATPWCEDPAFVWRSVGRRAQGTIQPNPIQIREGRLTSQKAVISKLNLFDRIKFRRKLRTLIDYIDLREKISMLMSEDAYQMRRLILSLAENLCNRGVIKERDDIFFLYISEVSGLIKGQLEKPRIHDLITERKAEFDSDLNVEPSDTICGDQITYKTMGGFDNQKYLVGICGSPGFVEGKARIVHDPSQAPEDINKTDILIVPFTDAGWTPLFTSIGGVVAETGGQLSHTSIIAREYGLPAIVSVKNAMTLIKDGQEITLNAHEGKVYLR
jgi:pyruvate,water dikinase